MKAELLSHTENPQLSVANAARVSFGKSSEFLRESDKKLIAYLWKNQHTSPFRHQIFTFRMTAPIFVARQLAKHHVGAEWNEISGRYVDFTTQPYFPELWREQSDDKKQGSSNKPVYDQHSANAEFYSAVEHCFRTYRKLLELGIAKEQARMILPMCSETQWIWTLSLQALIHLFQLRLKPDAQEETRNLVAAMRNLVKEIVPDVLEVAGV